MVSSSGEESSSEQRARRVRRRLRRSPSPTKTAPEDAHWPFWWLGAAAIAVFVASPPSWSPAILPQYFDLSTPHKGHDFPPPLWEYPSQFSTHDDFNMMFTPNYDDEHFFDAFKSRPRGAGLRFRDDAELHRIAKLGQQQQQQSYHAFPVLVQERPRSDMPGSGQPPALTQAREREGERSREPTLEDIELIDVLWRADIDSEKGAPSGQPVGQEQYERDLQLLTEKSIEAPLSREDTSRYEDLSKVYFEGFYNHRAAAGYVPSYDKTTVPRSPRASSSSSSSSSDSSSSSSTPSPSSSSPKRDIPTPTDEELDALFEDMGKECGELNRVLGSGSACSANAPPTGLLHNVSLSSIVPFNPANVTELDYSTANQQPSLAPVPLALVPNATNGYPEPTSFWFENNDGASGYQSREPVLNMSTLSLPPLVNNVSQQLQEDATLPPAHHELTQLTGRMNSYSSEQRNSVRVSISNDSSICSSSSSSSSTSPHYSAGGSDGENRSPRSRFFGKLAPLRQLATTADVHYDETDDEDDGHVDSFFSRKPISSSSSSGTVAQRRRGRQSKDEQLASDSGLPVSAAIIAEMSLPELQRLLKSESLTDHQKLLIRKIRRRGKNKVAARTCRQRRGQVRTAQMQAFESARVLGYSNRH